MSNPGQPARATHPERRTVAAVIGFATFGSLSFSMAQAGQGRLMLATGAVAVACFVAMGFFGGTDEPQSDRGSRGEIARMSESEFDRLEDAVDRAAATLRSGTSTSAAEVGQAADDNFESIVRDALDELPEFVRSALENNVAVLVSDDGHKYPAYGYYSAARSPVQTTTIASTSSATRSSATSAAIPKNCAGRSSPRSDTKWPTTSGPMNATWRVSACDERHDASRDSPPGPLSIARP